MFLPDEKSPKFYDYITSKVPIICIFCVFNTVKLLKNYNAKVNIFNTIM